MARLPPAHDIRCDWTYWSGLACRNRAKFRAATPYGTVVRFVCGQHRSSAVKYGDYDITLIPTNQGAISS